MQQGPPGPDSQKKKKKMQQSMQGMITVGSVALLCLRLQLDTDLLLDNTYLVIV